jgi:hypothetical protein
MGVQKLGGADEAWRRVWAGGMSDVEMFIEQYVEIVCNDLMAKGEGKSAASQDSYTRRGRMCEHADAAWLHPLVILRSCPYVSSTL